MTELQKILPRPEVEQALGIPRSTLYDMIARGQFPRPIKVSRRRVGWVAAEVAAFQAKRIAERDRRVAEQRKPQRRRNLSSLASPKPSSSARR
jgi:prophage regulatory protein